MKTAIKCKHCLGELSVTPQTFANGTIHMKAVCSVCNRHNGFVPQEVPATEYVMPFGKHQGKTLGWICQADRAYAYWALENLTSVRLVDRFVDALESTQGGIAS